MQELRKSFGAHTVLDGINLRVYEGEIVAVTGPNGSGKSTFLSCIIGHDTVDSGRVLFRGDTLDETNPVVRESIASLLDNIDFFPDLSVAEHLWLYAWAHGQESADLTVENILDELDLSDSRDQLPATLSSGQKHRLGLASCLVRPRIMLVLDEPEQRLDKTGQQWLMRRLDQERESGRAVVMATHNQALIDTTADRIVEITP